MANYPIFLGEFSPRQIGEDEANWTARNVRPLRRPKLQNTNDDVPWRPKTRSTLVRWSVGLEAIKAVKAAEEKYIEKHIYIYMDD